MMSRTVGFLLLSCGVKPLLCCSGGKDAPELNGILLNLVINGVGIAVTSWLFQRDLRARERDRLTVQREESLARLQARAVTA